MEEIKSISIGTRYIWLVSLFLLPFFQGGYFHYEVFAFLIIQVLVFLVRENKGISFSGMLKGSDVSMKILFIMMLLIPLGGIVASFTAIDPGTHFIGLLRMFGLVFFGLNLLSFGEIGHELQVKVFAFGGAIMSIVTFLAISLLTYLPDIGNHFVQNGRIGGFFQYANTYGSYLLVCILILSQTKIDKRIKWLLTVFMAGNILLTQSRGTLILGLMLLVWMIVFDKKKAYLLTAIGFGLGIGQTLLITLGDQIDSGRVTAISQNQSEWLSRLLYFEDGIKMIGKNIIGYGYGGYYQIQSYYQTGASYHVRFIHNSLLQMTLDYGLIGGLGFLTLLVAPVFLILKYLRKRNRWTLDEGEREGFWWMIAFYLMTLHAMIDFDFQFYAWLILYIWIGIQMFTWLIGLEGHNSRNIIKVKKRGDNRSRLRLSITIRRLILLVSAGLYGFFFLVTYLQYEGKNMESYALYPYYTKNISSLLKDQPLSPEMADIATKAIENNPYYTRGFAFLRDYHYNNGDFNEAVFYGRKAVEAAPLDMVQLEAYLTVAYSDLLVKYRQGMSLEDLAQYQDITNTEHYLKQLESIKKNNYTIKHQVDFKMTDYMREIVSRTVKLLNGD